MAVVGAGPSGLAAARHLLDAGLEVVVFEASGAIGGQWNTGTEHSGVWPGLHTNTSRALTCFADLPHPADVPLHPASSQVAAYLHAYATRFDLHRHVRLDTPVRELAIDPRGAGHGWAVDGEPFDGAVVASGRFRRPWAMPGLDAFTGDVLHAFDFPGPDALAGRSVLVLGNGVSGLEIACSLAGRADVVSAFRKPRYVIEKVSRGVSSDWRWYTHHGALERRHLPPEAFGDRLRRRIVADAGEPSAFGAPAPDPDIRVAGTSLAQGYLQAVAAGEIVCRPGVAGVDGQTVEFTDGTTASVDTIVCATGYAQDLPYLHPDAAARWSSAPYLNTWHPDLPTLGVLGQFLMQGPYFPVLELQARWVAAVFAGTVELPDEAAMRSAPARPPLEAHNAIVLPLAEALGVSPDLDARPHLTEGLLFGPMLPSRYRLDGPGATAGAEATFVAELDSAPRAPVAEQDVMWLYELGLGEAAGHVSARR